MAMPGFLSRLLQTCSQVCGQTGTSSRVETCSKQHHNLDEATYGKCSHASLFEQSKPTSMKRSSRRLLPPSGPHAKRYTSRALSRSYLHINGYRCTSAGEEDGMRDRL